MAFRIVEQMGYNAYISELLYTIITMFSSDPKLGLHIFLDCSCIDNQEYTVVTVFTHISHEVAFHALATFYATLNTFHFLSSDIAAGIFINKTIHESLLKISLK
jgi:hypothetical protein